MLVCALIFCTGLVQMTTKKNKFLLNNEKATFTINQTTSAEKSSQKVNLVLEMLENNPTNSQKCSSEWTNHGTYCNYQALEQYAITDKTEYVQTRDEIKKNLYGASKGFLLLKKFIDKITSSINGNYEDPKKKASKIKIATFCNSSNSSFYFAHWHNIEQNTTVNSTIDKCWDAMIAVRSNSLCGLCSGRSHLFFFRDKVLVEEEVCNKVINDCRKAFSDLVIYFEGASIIASDLAQATSSTSRCNEIKKYLEESKKINEQISKEKLVQLISNYIEHPDDMQAEKAICEKFVNIHEKNQIKKMSENIKKTKEILYRLLRKQIVLSALKDEMPNSNFRSSSKKPRRLQQSEDLNSNITLFFSGDVIMVPPKIDSSYTSFFGAIGTSSNELAHHSALPINTTSAFV